MENGIIIRQMSNIERRRWLKDGPSMNLTQLQLCFALLASYTYMPCLCHECTWACWNQRWASSKDVGQGGGGVWKRFGFFGPKESNVPTAGSHQTWSRRVWPTPRHPHMAPRWSLNLDASPLEFPVRPYHVSYIPCFVFLNLSVFSFFLIFSVFEIMTWMLYEFNIYPNIITFFNWNHFSFTKLIIFTRQFY